MTRKNMKKALLVLMVIVLLAIGYIGYSSIKNSVAIRAAAELAGEETTSDRADVVIKENLFIGQIMDINFNYKDYLGKSIKLEGIFRNEQRNERNICTVYRFAGCCAADVEFGYEVSWDQNHQGNAAIADFEQWTYPNTDDWVEALGVLKRYERDGVPFLYIALSEINVLDKRGAETVSR